MFSETAKHMMLVERKNVVLTRIIIGLVMVLLALVIAPFFSPVPVMVGDVCLSCWGK